jgi:ribonuclease HI
MWSKEPADTPFKKVSDLIEDQNKSWKEPIVNQLFYPQEARQICNLPLPNLDQDDFIGRQGTKDGIYSVKSGYQAVIEWQESQNSKPTRSHIGEINRWKKLWKLNVPPKQIHFLWRILNNALPAKENLANRGIRCNPLCSLCNSKIETIDHIFLACDWTRQAWFSSPLTINLAHLTIKHFPDWLDYMIDNTTKEDMPTISTILYNIWIARNEREFNNRYLPPTEMMNRAMKNLYEFQAHQSSKLSANRLETHRNNNGWSLPPKGKSKLNVDAHSQSDGHWGLGLILRWEDESCVGAATRVRKGSNCALLAEAMGLQEAMELVDRWDLQNTIIEMDAKVIVDSVNQHRNPRTDWGKITTKCWEWMRNRQGITLKWTDRRGNGVAHELAKWADKEPNKDWIHNLPYCIISHIQKDMDLLPIS